MADMALPSIEAGAQAAKQSGWLELSEAVGGAEWCDVHLQAGGRGVAQEAPLYWSTEQRTAERHKWT